jgi:acetoin utilization deacetylase AcuC-like enzyme
MSLALYTHPDMLAHAPPRGHVERPERLVAVMDALADASDLDLEPLEAPLVTDGDLALVHTGRYVAALEAAEPAQAYRRLDPDTWLSPGSIGAARRAAGAVAAAVRRVAAGEAERAFCAVRPPGHHAGPETPMGFCLYSNVAIGARVAQAAGLARVAVVDFDVHHGNGSQDIFWADPTVMYGSTHQMPLYPGTGAKNERGEHDTIVNAPLRPGDAGEHFREAFESVILPRLADFAPQLLIISAGFDAHMRDPLANLNLLEADFAWATRKLMDVARKSAEGRVVSVLEGGYDLTALANSVAAHVTTLMQG